MKLIDNAHLWHRLWSIRLLILTALYDGAVKGWHLLPDGWRPPLSVGEQWALAAVGMALPAITAAAVLVRQESLASKMASNRKRPTVPDDSDQAGA